MYNTSAMKRTQKCRKNGFFHRIFPSTRNAAFPFPYIVCCVDRMNVYWKLTEDTNSFGEMKWSKIEIVNKYSVCTTFHNCALEHSFRGFFVCCVMSDMSCWFVGDLCLCRVWNIMEWSHIESLTHSLTHARTSTDRPYTVNNSHLRSILQFNMGNA